ncbi:MAG: tRNA lysidine(34) synthetase TilS [Firmicutes bacterium]|nr:tRNA lysidine(34) synthetase TilS [Bacillota bacterium]
MLDKILAYCQKHNLFSSDELVVAAVSGGPDSICLAHVLWTLREQLKIKLLVAHVNHQLRGAESEADARLVCSWAKTLAIPRVVKRIDLEAGSSMQARARTARYQALTDVCEAHGAPKLATGHHSNDQVETFLINLLRGSGGRGLAAIQPARPLNSQVMVVHPLLSITRAEIEAYCQEHKLPWRLDASNESCKYTRNRIRHHLLPVLRQYNPGVDQVLRDTVERLQAEQQLLEQMTEAALSKIIVDSPLPSAPVAVSVSGLSALEPALAARAIRYLLSQQDEHGAIEAKHVISVMELTTGQTGSSLDLPNDFKAFRLHDRIALGRMPKPVPHIARKLPIPGRVDLPELGASIVAETKQANNSVCLWVDVHTSELTVGNRRPGDWLNPGGGRKKLKDWLIDQKLPRWLRDYLVVVRTGDRVCWLPGLIVDLDCRQSGPGKTAVYLKRENYNQK